MTGQPLPAGFESYEKLRSEELQKIQLRRKHASTTQAPTEPGNTKLEDDLIGVALSGGGIRSAVFNLGFLQALSHRGFLRYVDYLCSVSGGGYVAGHLTALANSVAVEKNFHDIPIAVHEEAREIPAIPQERAAARPVNDEPERVSHLGVDKHGRLTPSYRFRHIGSYLFSDIAGFAWRYLLFTFITVLLVTSLLGIVASGAAYLWRMLDTESARDVRILFGISDLGVQLGVGDETLFAFLPSLVPFGLLVGSAVFRSMCHAIYYRRGREWFAGWCRFWLRCWGVSLAISFAVLFGNGEMSFSTGQTSTQVQANWTWPLMALVVVSLLPFLRFKSVIDSARPDAPAWKGFLAIALATLTCGAGPFFMVFWMARENVSGYAQYRDPILLRHDIQNWPAFIHLSETLNVDTKNARAAQDKAKEAQAFLDSTDVLGRSGWEAHERLPFHSVTGAWTRGEWLFRWAFRFPTTDGSNSKRSPNPISRYRELLKQQRDEQAEAVNQFNKSKLSERDLTIRLVAMACGIPVDPMIPADALFPANVRFPVSFPRGQGLAWQEDKDGSPTKVGTALAKRSRESGNLRSYWHRALLDSLTLPKTVAPAMTNAPTELQAVAVQRFLKPQLDDWTDNDVAKFNRLLLEALFPDVIRHRTMISTTIVPDKDQECRLQWLLLWTALSVGLLFVDWNVISPFYVFYRDKLSHSFVRSAGKLPRDPSFEEPDLRLADVEPWMRGAPYPLMLASMHFFRRVSATPSRRLETDPPDSDNCQPFFLSPLHCGSALAGWTPTGSYCAGEIKLADAVALSGAAVSPFMVNNLGITALMAMANLRIGQWLPLPRTQSRAKSRPRADGWRIGRELWTGLISSASPADYLERTCRMALVADGGFHEFFGLEELLLRRCRLVLVADAGCNNGRYEFGALADALRLLRVSHGLEFLDLDHEKPIDLTLLKRGDAAQQTLHHCCFRVRYPKSFPVQDGPAETLVVYAQMSLTGDEELDLQQFRNVNPNFPDEPTTNQRYSAGQVESYRQLGFHIGEIVCGAVPQTHANRVTAAEWGAWFSEGYVAEWRRLTSSEVPTPGTNAQAVKLIGTAEFREVDDAISKFLTTPKKQQRWHEYLDEWFSSGKRPRSSLPEKFPTAVQIAQLVLACEAYISRGGDLVRAEVFHPGGRARLCQFACRSGQRFALDRKELLRDLHNIAFVSGQSECPASTRQPSSMKSPSDDLSAGLRLAADLLVFWDLPLPKHRFECAVDPVSEDYPHSSANGQPPVDARTLFPPPRG